MVGITPAKYRFFRHIINNNYYYFRFIAFQRKVDNGYPKSKTKLKRSQDYRKFCEHWFVINYSCHPAN